jgi:hypothetical protein
MILAPGNFPAPDFHRAPLQFVFYIWGADLHLNSGSLALERIRPHDRRD